MLLLQMVCFFRITASRYESTSEPMRIHCSEATKKVLDELGGYHFDDRGTVHLKGKGEWRSFWVLSEDVARSSRNRRTLATSTGMPVSASSINGLASSAAVQPTGGRSILRVDSSARIAIGSAYHTHRQSNVDITIGTTPSAASSTPSPNEKPGGGIIVVSSSPHGRLTGKLTIGSRSPGTRSPVASYDAAASAALPCSTTHMTTTSVTSSSSDPQSALRVHIDQQQQALSAPLKRERFTVRLGNRQSESSASQFTSDAVFDSFESSTTESSSAPFGFSSTKPSVMSRRSPLAKQISESSGRALRTSTLIPAAHLQLKRKSSLSGASEALLAIRKRWQLQLESRRRSRSHDGAVDLTNCSAEESMRQAEVLFGHTAQLCQWAAGQAKLRRQSSSMSVDWNGGGVMRSVPPNGGGARTPLRKQMVQRLRSDVSLFSATRQSSLPI